MGSFLRAVHQNLSRAEAVTAVDDKTRLHVIVKGVVQGVGFRYFAVQLARDYGITGWVRNKEDGSVEVEAEGEDLIVRSFVKDLGIGPRGAHVSCLDVKTLPVGHECKDFTVRF
jgi:acylphosphatase